MWSGWILGFAGYNAAAFCEQDTVQALDWEALKTFSRGRICGQKPAEQSWAAVGAELWDGHGNLAGESSRVQSQGRVHCEGSSSSEEAKKRPDSHTRENPENCVSQACSARADSLSAPELSERRGLAAQGGVSTELIWKCCMKRGILRNVQRKAPAPGSVLGLVTVFQVVLGNATGICCWVH